MYVCAPLVLVPLILQAKIMRILSLAPLRRAALIEWEQSVTDETSDSGPWLGYTQAAPSRSVGRRRRCVCAAAKGGNGTCCVPVTKWEPLGLWRLPWL